MKFGLRIGFVSAMATWGAACADDSPPKLDHCIPAWSVQENAPVSAALAWADGVLYAAGQSGIETVPAVRTWAAPIVNEPYATDLWVQGDNILYAVEDRLMQIPRTGGQPTTLVDGGHGAKLFAPGHLYDGTYFTWASSDDDWTTADVWRIPLSGGAAERYPSLGTTSLGTMYVSETVLAPVADGVLGANLGYGGRAKVAPWGQSGPRILNVDRDMDFLLTVDSNGALWTSVYGNTVGLAPADGSAWRVLSTKLPRAHWAFSDGKGGYFIARVETFDDGNEHDSIWYLPADGSAERIACNPYGSFGYGKAALAPDALYVSTKRPAPMGSIVRIELRQQP